MRPTDFAIRDQRFGRSGLVKVAVLLLWFLLCSSPTAADPPQQAELARSVHTPATSSESKEVEPPSVEMDFHDVDIRDFVSYVSKVTGERFIVGPNVKGRITLVSPHKVPVNEVFSVFQSVLEVHGYTTVEAGSMVKVVASATARGKSLETGLGEELGTAEDKMVTQVIRLNYLSPGDAARLLTPLVSEGGVILSYPRSGMLIVTDFLSNIQRLQQIIKAMDAARAREEISVVGE